MGALLAITGALAIARQTIETQRARFETDARIVHRLLSQQVVQHDAILDTLALLQPTAAGGGGPAPEQRLTALYPHMLAVQRRERDGTWPDQALAVAEQYSRAQRRASLVEGELGSGRYRLVLAAQPTAYALTIDLRGMVPWSEWPTPADSSPVRVTLEHQGQRFELQPGDAAALDHPGGWWFTFYKPLAAASQPFDVHAEQRLGWSQLPWGAMLGWSAGAAVVLALAAQGLRQRTARRRAEELLSLGQVARLNTLGELAAGMAHELNQPLTAVLANTQAAQRLLREDPPDLDTARQAMGQAVDQSRRAAEVVGRLRRTVESRPPASGQPPAENPSLDLTESARHVLHLLEPECRRRGVEPVVQTEGTVNVAADPVAIDQILHNLLMNALQAMEAIDPSQRTLHLNLRRDGSMGELVVADRGSGIAPDALPRLFEPFFTTREAGLGLGLSLCETLTQGMGGSLTAANRPDGGALFTLRVPLRNVK